MAGIDNPNIASYYIDTTQQRTGETPNADWDGGLNYGASCSPGVGINTGDYNPKESDWDRQTDGKVANGQHIGVASDPSDDEVKAWQNDGADVNDNFAFVTADAQTAPDAVLDVTTGAVNKTGKTVPAGAWCWGLVPNA